MNTLYLQVFLKFVTDILAGLRKIHDERNKIVHLDLKPENIMANIDDDDIITLKITDFGVSKPNGETIRSPVGTITTMAPEVFNAFGPQHLPVASPSMDVFSFGVVVWSGA